MTPTSEILNRAADIIETRGWTTGESVNPWGIGDPKSPVCLEGGILAATGLRGIAGLRLVEECPAARAVHEYLGLATETALWDWNDGHLCGPSPTTRTAEQVIEVLRATAVIEAARENSSVTEEVSA